MAFSQLDYENKLNRERQFHAEGSFRNRHVLNSRMFFSVARNEFNYTFARQQLAALVQSLVGQKGERQSKILIAPIGAGLDLPFLSPISKNLTGIDISPEAIALIKDNNITKAVGDMKRMPQFQDGSFDIVVSSLFYHHFLQFGFDDYLRESFRVLRPGGYLVAMEPSSLHPLHWATGIARRIFGNITGTVADEAPFNPQQLVEAMTRCGFRGARTYGASFSHHRLPIWLARINNAVTFPLLKAPFIHKMAWMCLFCGQKAT